MKMVSCHWARYTAQSTSALRATLHHKLTTQDLNVQHREKLLREKHGDMFAPLTHRTGWRGVWGPRVESRRHYLAEIWRCEAQIDEERHRTFNTSVANSFFVIFDSQARTLHCMRAT
jgi:Cytosolic domain of 10TM putative phosphate transporter